jgi:hypothetical protein
LPAGLSKITILETQEKIIYLAHEIFNISVATWATV